MSSPDSLKSSQQASLLGLSCNGFLAFAKILSGVVGHSQALVADGIESLTDLAGSLIVWRAVVVSHQPADYDHPRGHGRAETLAAGFVGFSLFSAAFFIMVQSLGEIIHPHHAPKIFTLPVILVAIAIKTWLSHRVGETSEEVASSALKADAFHHRTDALSSTAAAIGISIALIGGHGYERADSCAAVIAALIIFWNGFHILQPVISELMEKSPPAEFLQRIRDIAQKVQGVDQVEKCFARRMGKGFFVEMHVEVNPSMNVEKAHSLAHQVKNDVQHGIHNVYDVLVHVEPFRGHKSS